MAETRRLLDIWIVESNTAYRGVPFETVANWLQQGRLLGEDRIRPAGTQDWFRIDKVRALIPYLPRAEAQRVEDTAEALEPIEPELAWRHPGDAEEDDPDMIPLIDIALVLLIFFMMTAAVQSGMFTPIDTPSALYQLTSIKEGTYFVAIAKDAKVGKDGRSGLRYAVGKDDKEWKIDDKKSEDAPPDMTDVLAHLAKELAAVKGEVRVSLRADKQLSIETIKNATLELQGLEAQLNAKRGLPEDRVSFLIRGEVRSPAK